MQIRNLQQLPEDVNFSTSLRDRRVSFWMFVFFKLFLWDCFYPRLAKKKLKNTSEFAQFLINLIMKKFETIFLKISLSIVAKDWKSCGS